MVDWTYIHGSDYEEFRRQWPEAAAFFVTASLRNEFTHLDSLGRTQFGRSEWQEKRYQELKSHFGMLERCPEKQCQWGIRPFDQDMKKLGFLSGLMGNDLSEFKGVDMMRWPERKILAMNHADATCLLENLFQSEKLEVAWIPDELMPHSISYSFRTVAGGENV